MKHVCRKIFSQLAVTAAACLILKTTAAANINGTLQEVKDLSALAQSMRDSDKPLVLAFDAEHCHYCARLQADHLDPMTSSEDYQHVLIRSLELDGTHKITDFDGQPIKASAFSARYNVRITPTLLFLNARGEEIAERMLGYTTPEFYGVYLDRAIDKAIDKMENRTQSTEEVQTAAE